VFRAKRMGGLERVHSDGDKDVLRGRVEDGVVQENGLAYVEPGNGTAMGGAEKSRGRGETAMGIWRGKCKRFEERAPSGSWGPGRSG
jgi:hypothetical protein